MKRAAPTDNSKEGFTLIETLIAVMVISIAMVGPLTLTQKSLSTARVSEEQVSAFYLAQDALEYVKNVRDDNQKNGRPWLSKLSQCLDAECVIDTTVPDPLIALSVASGSYCKPLRLDAATNRYGCNGAWSVSPFTRTITLDSSSDPNREVMAVVTVTYPAGSFTREYKASISLFNIAEAIQIAADMLSGTTSTTTLGDPPTCDTFFANPTTISAGQFSLLTWATSDASTVSFSPPIGSTALSETDYPVSPTATTTYVLTASNAYGSNICQVQVRVSAAESPVGDAVAYWPFETNANDISGNGRNGTLTNGAAITGASKIGVGALSLDGTDDYVSVANHATLQGDQNLTISVWVRSSTTSEQMLIGKSNGANSKEWELRIIPETGIFGWLSENNNSNYALSSPVGMIAMNTWYHLAAVLDKDTDTLRLYRNGTLAAEDPSFGDNSDATNAPISIGRRGYSNSLYVKGEMDEMQFFNRALSASDIYDLYLSGSAGADTAPPTISGATPSGTLAYGTTQTNMTITTNENATCKWSTTDQVYASMPNTFTTTGGANHSYTLIGLTNGTSYTRYIRCQDTSGNANTASRVVAFSVASAPGSMMVAHWPFDTGANDLSGNAYNGTLVGNAMISATAPKIGNGSLLLDGSGDYVTLGDILDFSATQSFSVSLWAKPTASNATTTWRLLAKRNSGTPPLAGYMLAFGTLQEFSSVIDDGAASVIRAGATGNPVGQWKHMVMVVNRATQQMTTYTDGAPSAAASISAIGSLANAAALTIGSASNPGNYFKGYIDDVRVFNYALSGGEVTALYNLGSGDSVPPVISNPAPSGTLAAGTTQTNMTVTTNENATCKWSTTDVAYASMPNTFTTTGATSHSYLLTGLTDGTSYVRYIRCSDAVGNANTASAIVSFSVAVGSAHLVAHWPFDTAFTDVSGSGYHGTAAGNAALSSVSPRVGGGSLVLDGSGDAVSVADIPEMNGASKVSVAGWYKDKVPASSAFRFPFAKFASGFVDFHSAARSGVLYIDLGNGSADTFAQWGGYGSAVPADTWFHLALVFDGTQTGNANRLKLYINNAQQTLTFTGTIPATTQAALVGDPFRIGAQTASAGFWNGNVDDLRVYDSALTATEIASLYNLGSGSDTTAPVLSGATPSGTLAAGTTQVNMTVTTNENATCKWSTTDQAYASMPNTFTTTGATSHSYNLTGLTNGSSYTRYIRCIDGAGNANTTSTVVSFSVASGSGVPTAGLVGYWPFDGNANDLSGNGYHGSFGGAAGITSAAAIGSGALDVNGGYVDIGDVLDMSATQSFTIAAWAKPAAASAVVGNIVAKRNGGSNPIVGYSLRFHTTEAFVPLVDDGTDTVSPSSGTPNPIGSWTFATMVVDRSANTISLYRNAVLDEGPTSIASVGNLSNLQSLRIGVTSNGGGTFNGDIDAVRIYNRALALSEIQALYNEASGSDTTAPVLSGAAPSGTLAAGTTQVNMTVTTNENATCKWSTTDQAYASMPNTFTTTGATSHSYLLTGLTNGSSYTRYIRCIDGAGNANTTSTVVSFSVASGSGVPTAGLVGYWPFDGNANDTSGNGNHGTFNGNAAVSTSVKRIGAGSLSLDGTGDFVLVGDPASGILDVGDEDFTISFWSLKPSWNTAGTAERAISKETSTGDKEYSINFNNTTGNQELRLEIENAGNNSMVSAVNAISTGVWQHILVTFDASSRLSTFYVDGVSQSTTGSIAALPTVLTGSLHFGKIAYGTNYQYFLGNLDEIRIYNRILNASEIASLYAQGSGSDTTAPVLSGAAPSGTLAAGTTQVNMTVTTNENATCKWSTTDVAYASMPNTFTTTGATSHSYNLTGLTNGSSYTRYIRCIDGAGNANTTSTVVSFSVANAADTTPPTVSGGTPSGTLAAGTTQVNMTVTTNENATCKWNATNVAYGSMANTFSTTGATSHSTTLTGLTDGSSYTRYVRCQDTAGNPMTTSEVISFSVASGGPAGLVAHWKFNEASGNAIDSENGLVGTQQMTIPRITGPNDGNAADLNGGASSYYQVPDTATLDLVNGITLAAWVRPNDKTQDSFILTKKCFAGDNGYHLRINTRIRFEWGNASTESDFELSTANIMQDDVWQHVAATYDETTVKFYRNGVLQGSAAHAGTMAASTEPLRIGAASCGAGGRADADIDGVRIYNRALNLQEIQDIYNDGS